MARTVPLPDSGSFTPPPGADLRDVLAEAGSLAPEDRLELLRVDQERQWTVGRKIPAEAYLALMPAESETGEDAFELIYAEFVIRSEQGEPPSWGEFAWRFPQFAERLAEQLELRRALDEWEPPENPDSSDPQAGSTGPTPPQIPGYDVVRLLGRGGMGAVYLAHRHDPARTVALKVVLAGAHARPEDVTRFLAEAQAVARLDHPNVVRVWEVGRHEGLPFLALEYVEGESLAEALRRGIPSPDDAAGLIEVLAGALEDAHARGIIHRDLKPSNILLEGPPDAPLGKRVPKVADFGLAKLGDVRSGAGSRPFSPTETATPGTLSGAVIGTPGYMAPEQARGQSHKVGPPADIYALGAILYEMLTGRPPFLAATPIQAIMQVIRDDPVPPIRLRPDVPRDLEVICLKCLRKDARQRYGSARELAEDLQRYLHRNAIRARPMGRIERWARWSARRPVRATLTIMLILASVLGVVELLSRLRTAEDARHALRLQVEREQVIRRQVEKARRVALDALNDAESSLYRYRILQADQKRRAGDIAGAEAILERCAPTAGRADPRRWEWHLLRTLNQDPRPTILKRTRGPIDVLGFTSDGQSLFGRDETQSLRAWPLSESTSSTHFRRTPGPTVVSADGHRVVAIEDATTLTWGQLDEPDRPLRTVKILGEPIVALAVSRNGALLAVGSVGVVRLIELPDGDVLWKSPVPGLSAPCPAFAPDAQTLVAVGTDGMVHGIDVATGHVRFRAVSIPEATGVAFGPDGQRLVIASRDRLDLHDTEDGLDVLVLERPSGTAPWVGAPAFDPEGRKLAIGGEDGTITIWDASPRSSRAGP